jgi:hypothetical protein
MYALHVSEICQIVVLVYFQEFYCLKRYFCTFVLRIRIRVDMLGIVT